MEWPRLLQDTRFRPQQPLQDFDGRNPFENDYSRLISSSFIRRLQDKTQVFPLHESDFIRTRLTHSLEVSSIAKSIGRSVEKVLVSKGLMDPSLRELLPSLLCTAGLIHDIGNPPYGHFGETAIKDFFKKHFTKDTTLNEQEQNDFLNFDGNVQTFRILRKLQFMGDFDSYNLTLPTLASIVKYPKNSVLGNKGKKTEDVHEKKFGFFVTEEKDYQHISDVLGLSGKRHPATFLLEAADDIAYSAADIEDGIKLGILDYDIIHSVFESTIKNEELNKMVLGKLEKFKDDFIKFNSDALSLIVTRFRIFTQGLMIQSVITKFCEQHDDILSGNYSKEILLESYTSQVREAFKKLSGIVFKNNHVIQAELAGYEIMYGLMNKFVEASTSSEFGEDGKDLEGRLYNIISSSLRYLYTSNNDNYPKQEYLKYQLIIDFISGMTDTYAINYYKKIKGISY